MNIRVRAKMTKIYDKNLNLKAIIREDKFEIQVGKTEKMPKKYEFLKQVIEVFPTKKITIEDKK